MENNLKSDDYKYLEYHIIEFDEKVWQIIKLPSG